jgi:hypothetical protein
MLAHELFKILDRNLVSPKTSTAELCPKTAFSRGWIRTEQDASLRARRRFAVPPFLLLFSGEFFDPKVAPLDTHGLFLVAYAVHLDRDEAFRRHGVV